MLYGYVDYTLEVIPRPFYVGIGNSSRVKSKHRNRQHTDTVNRLGWKRVIEFETTSERLLETWEVDIIAKYHTYVHDPLYNGIGCNLVKGGHRNSGRIDGPEVRQKRGRAISRARQGKPPSQAQLDAAKQRRGRKLPARTLTWKQNLSKALIGKKHKCGPKSDITKQKISAAAIGNTNGIGNRGVIRHCRLCHETGHDSRNCSKREII